MKKFSFLRAAVKGAAAKVMGKWAQTAKNYDLAWNRLFDVYQDDYLAVQTLIRRMLSIPRMNEPTNEGLPKIIDTINECVQQLGNFVDPENWDPMIVFMAIDLMDMTTYEAWEKYRQENEIETGSNAMELDDQEADGAAVNPQQNTVARKCFIPCWKEMRLFLDKRARILVHASHRDRSNEPNRRNRDSSQGNSRNSSRNRQAQSQTAVNPARNKPPTGYPLCIIETCRKDHPLFKCDEFMSKSLNGRKAFVAENHLCRVCLRMDHQTSECTRPPCDKCKHDKHNKALCPAREADRRTAALQAQTTQQVGASSQKFLHPSGGAIKKVPKGQRKGG